MKLEQHPSYSTLQDWEQELCQGLIASDLERELLPFRVDSRIFDAVIVAAECASEGAVLVVASEDHVEAWVEAWSRQGCRGARRARTRPTDQRVAVVTPRDLRNEARSFQMLVYSAVLVAGCVEDAGAGWVASQIEAHRAWRLSPQPAAATETWPLGLAGRALYLGDAPYTFQPTHRSRPSALAEPLAA